MRINVMDRVAEDLRRFRVYSCGYGFEIRDTKNHAIVKNEKREVRFFHNRGRAQKVADKLEAEHLGGEK